MGGRVRRERGRSPRIGTSDNPSPPTATATVAVVAPVAWTLWIRTAEAASAVAPWAIHGCGAASTLGFKATTLCVCQATTVQRYGNLPQSTTDPPTGTGSTPARKTVTLPGSRRTSSARNDSSYSEKKLNRTTSGFGGWACRTVSCTPLGALA